MNKQIFMNLILEGILWGITYYFIQQKLNPEIDDVTKFRTDAIYGSLAVFVSGVLSWYYIKSA